MMESTRKTLTEAEMVAVIDRTSMAPKFKARMKKTLHAQETRFAVYWLYLRQQRQEQAG